LVRIGFRYLILVLALALPRAAAAQTASLSGRVTDSQGGVVIGATVTLAAAGSGVRATERTTEQGTFTFAPVPFGRYAVQVDEPGFVSWRRDVAVGAAMPPVSVTLQIAGVLEDVQVSGTAPFTLEKPIPTASRLGLSPLDTPASVAVVSGNLIRDLGTTS
jgi:carboxypeptidase family protein